MMKKQNVCLIIVFTIFLSFYISPNVSKAGEFDLFQDELTDGKTISVIDPETKIVVKKFTPDIYQLITNIESYRNEIENWVHEFANGTNNHIGYNKPMLLDRIDEKGRVIKGRPLITVNEKELVDKIIDLSFTGGLVEIPIIFTESDYSENDVPHFNEVVLATYTTYFKSYHSGRSKNIELSAMAINNVILGNGDIFSFNSVVGPRDVASGYQMAPEIIKGKMVMGIGGGICQTSSTLFNAVDQLELKILERHHHSKEVGYVPKGRDATVSFGGLDFQFQNTTGVPFIIKSYYQQGAITIQIKTSKEYEHILKHEFS
ncbi:VanW family protein [Ureibacillus galli]|nr:VanW family protein [Ureibacillus galli]